MPMKQINLVFSGTNFDESWISDIYIGPEFNGSHKVYFTTGNTRVNDATPKNHKDPLQISDLYFGELNLAEDKITNISSVSLPLGLGFNDVFCLYVDEGLDLMDPVMTLPM